jgi:mRNA degradation ribonuclease J1/J2
VVTTAMNIGLKHNKNLKKYQEQIIQIHTSGHIDKENLIYFVEKIKPKNIIPIHTTSIEYCK